MATGHHPCRRQPSGAGRSIRRIAMPDPRSAPVTAPVVRATKRRDGHPPLVMVTAYDAPGARIADAAGVDLILVGDSVANNVLGYEDTLQVTVADMAHHTAAVARAKPKPLIVA